MSSGDQGEQGANQEPNPPSNTQEEKDPNQVNALGQPEQTQQPAAAYPAGPPPPYTHGGYQQPPPGAYPQPPPGAVMTQPMPGTYPPPPAGMYYGAAGPPPGAAPAGQATTTTTYVIKDVEPPPPRVNHCLHCLISIIFWPWFFVWCALCIMESKEMDRYNARVRNTDY